eukprot:1146502-Pelagomonas_calceolata.AAC.1
MPFWQSAAHLFAEAQSHFLGEASSVAPVPLLTALLIGALTGYALPRPSTDPAKSGPLHSIATFLGNTSLRRFFLAWHGVNIIRCEQLLSPLELGAATSADGNYLALLLGPQLCQHTSTDIWTTYTIRSGRCGTIGRRRARSAALPTLCGAC